LAAIEQACGLGLDTEERRCRQRGGRRRENEGEEEEEEFSGGHTLAWIGGGLWVQSRYGEAPPYSPDTRYVN